ncbi:phage tail sheath C-terminal domain-containing protein [Fibrobacter sp. UWP2]|uniref:phage tail sheath C-terminal domain-containing protein n=1 Tax=Fibrobacter sp. UWP2 TaxID=1896216 RepID=UPI0009209BE4|nr:phage tail sheath C-terminal domain-containing protein [Fibrobacter sp. UWP2]SHJ39629.1 Mu-like prophage tail sheath protein gpL [Fibrobacter sp. UWP2]
MTIPFNEIPAGNLVPIFAVEINNERASKPGPMPWKNLLIGQAVGAIDGSTPDAEKKWRPSADNTGKLVRIMEGDQADSLFGRGSQIALMAKNFLKNAPYMELYCLALADAPAGSGQSADAGKATKTLTFAGPATESGSLNLNIAGQAVTVTVIDTDNAATIAGNVKAKIDSLVDLPVVATVASNVVTLTAKNKGAAGNDLAVFLNLNEGEKTPAGVSISEFASTDVIKLADGSGDTEFTAENVGNLIEGTWFNAIAINQGDNTNTGNVAYIKEKLDERWTAMKQQTGVLFYCVGGDMTAEITAGNARNSHVLCLPGLPDSPTAPCNIAAAVMGACAASALNDPALPLSNVAVKGVVAPKRAKRLGVTSRNAILEAGVAALFVGDDGTVYLNRTVTTYKYKANGASDISYRQLETVLTLSFLRWDWNNYLSGKYPRAKLAADGDEFGPGQIVMTPKKGMSELLTRYQDWMKMGLVQNFDLFKQNVVVELDPNDPNALLFLAPANLIKQFFISKTLLQFE